MKIIKPIFVAASAAVAILLSQTTPVSAQDTASLSNPGSGPSQFANLYVTINGTGDWFEMPYTPGTPFQFNLYNANFGPQNITDAGFFLSPTLIPLDDLNNTSDYPLPSQPSSPYTPVPSLDELLPAQGVDISASITPSSAPDQASTLVLFSLATAGLLVFRRTIRVKAL